MALLTIATGAGPAAFAPLLVPEEQALWRNTAPASLDTREHHSTLPGSAADLLFHRLR